MDESNEGSSSAPRSRLFRASSSREVSREEEVVGQEEVPEVHPEHDEDDAQDAEEGSFPGGPFDTSLFIFYHDHAARCIWDVEPTIKSVNHSQKILYLFKPQAQWFNDVVAGSGLGGLCMTTYSTISRNMQGDFAEGWHKETSSFHFPVGELTIILHDVACLLHLPIRGGYWTILGYRGLRL
ncbi:protein MAIN-LIKE 2-like [Vicia villosa]|uniref:protein MAIN-LIKE 2-like n=1 Tax=Vicia villosa TaxID=3911 RepID=UPI00273CAE5D|nr:protein MAIN-LIKE 2-like [Vicia villosa]